jgi:PAS domain S-box-containing protein
MANQRTGTSEGGGPEEPGGAKSALSSVDDRRPDAGKVLDPHLLRRMLDAAGDLIYVKDLEGAYLACNKASEKLVGVSEAEQVGKTDFDFFPREFAEAIREEDRVVMTSGIERRVEEWVTYPDGTRVLMESQKAPLHGAEGRIAGLVGVSRDITARKRAEEALREKEARYRAIIEGFDGFINISSSDLRVEFTNKASARRDGRDPIGERCHDVLYGLSDRCPWCRMDAIQRGETIRREMCDPLNNRWYYAIDTPVFHADGRISKQTVAVDISDRRRAEDALRQSEEKFRTLVDNLNVGVFRATASPPGRFLQVNPAMAKMLGYPSPLVLMEVPLVDLLQDPRQGAALFEEFQARGVVRNREIVLEKADGTSVVVSMTATAQRDERGGNKWADGVLEDVTERKRMEAEIIKAQKLESLGLLAGGIAHDFNNLLTAIVGNNSLARDLAPAGSELLEVLADVEAAASRAQALTGHLLTFAKGGVPVKKPVGVGALVASSARLALSGSKAACQLDIPGDLWPIDADDMQMTQVLSNLVLNAAQAMPGGGRITIRCRNVLSDSRALPLADGRCVEIAVQDEGIGIKREELGKIFDPFFTTKEQGRGLGLSTAYSIVKQHRGSILVESMPGSGSTFTLLLPASCSLAAPRPAGGNAFVAGKGKILVMDDDTAIQRALQRLLGRLGYEAECASDGAEALELYARELGAGRRFDVVIMDLTIPGGMGGKDAVRRLLEIDPHAKAIVSSGYSSDPIMSQFESFGFAGVIGKPYTLGDLGDALRRTVRSSGAVGAGSVSDAPPARSGR